jgi:mycothiol synthase
MMELRELQDADFPEVLALCEHALPLDPWTLPGLHLHVRGEPDHDRAMQLTLWDDQQLVGILLGGLRGIDKERHGVLRLFAIHASYRRRGYATTLLGAFEERMHQRGIDRLRIGGAPDYFWPGLDVRYTPAFCLLERHGWHRTADAVNMRVDLRSRDWTTTQHEARLEEDGFVVRRLTLADREHFAKWLGTTWNASWRYEGLLSYTNEPISTFVATRNEQIVAFATYGITPYIYGFGPTGTDPSLQGRGIGRVLFYRCMQDLHSLGNEWSEVQWTGPISFYARIADAQMHRVFWLMTKDL